MTNYVSSVYCAWSNLLLEVGIKSYNLLSMQTCGDVNKVMVPVTNHRLDGVWDALVMEVYQNV